MIIFKRSRKSEGAWELWGPEPWAGFHTPAAVFMESEAAAKPSSQSQGGRRNKSFNPSLPLPAWLLSLPLLRQTLPEKNREHRTLEDVGRDSLQVTEQDKNRWGKEVVRRNNQHLCVSVGSCTHYVNLGELLHLAESYSLQWVTVK